MSTTCVGWVVLVPAILLPRVKLRFAGWHRLALPPACGCCEAAGVDAPAPAFAVEPGSADEAAAEPLGVLPESVGEVAAELLDELEELLDELEEQLAAPRPTATAQSATDMDARNRMEFPRSRKCMGVVRPGVVVRLPVLSDGREPHLVGNICERSRSHVTPRCTRHART